NNAAAHGTEVPPLPITEGRDGHYDAIMTVNLRSAYVLARELGRGMASRRRGAIINISSIAATWTTPGHGLYAASKAALESLTRTLALELGPSGIRVNAIAPGLIATPGLAASAASAE